MSDPIYRSLLKRLEQFSPYQDRSTVFSDFVFLSAAGLRNAYQPDKAVENEYLRRIKNYKHEDARVFPVLLGMLIEAMGNEPADVLGPLFMELGLGQAQLGQFFTPPHVSDLIASMIHGADKSCALPLRVNDPACGSGGMLLAAAGREIRARRDPGKTLWVEGVDIHRTSALMAYVQVSLWGLRGQIFIGDSLRMEMREVWRTPASFWPAPAEWEGPITQPGHQAPKQAARSQNPSI